MRALITFACAALLASGAVAQDPAPPPATEPAAEPTTPAVTPAVTPTQETPAEAETGADEQQPEPAPPPVPLPVEAPPLPGLTGGPGDPGAADRQKMIELFQEVETRLRAIDDLLFDASAGESIDSQAESGIGDLLQQSIDNSKEVRDAMDRILELAAQQGQSQSGESSSPPPEGSPLDSQPPPGQGQQGSKESTPEGPEPGEKPGEKPEKPGQPEDQQAAAQETPTSPRDSLDDPQNQAAQDPQAGESGSPSGPQGNERWGDLPIHVRDLFRTEGGGEMPPQYRDWIDAYYRRLNQRP